MKSNAENHEIPAITIATLGLLCPLPIIKTARALKDVSVGAIVEVLSDDPGFIDDMPAWCGETGHDLLNITNEGVVIRARIRKRESAKD